MSAAPGSAGTRGELKGGGCCCCRLRWNGMFIDAEPDSSVPSPRAGLFWCGLTMTCLGPDGRVADEEGCRHGRSCFEIL